MTLDALITQAIAAELALQFQRARLARRIAKTAPVVFTH